MAARVARHSTLANGGVICKLMYINSNGDVCWGLMPP